MCHLKQTICDTLNYITDLFCAYYYSNMDDYFSVCKMINASLSVLSNSTAAVSFSQLLQECGAIIHYLGAATGATLCLVMS